MRPLDDRSVYIAKDTQDEVEVDRWQGLHRLLPSGSHTQVASQHAGHVLAVSEQRREQFVLEDTKAMFVYAPDTRIKVHPVKIAQGGE